MPYAGDHFISPGREHSRAIATLRMLPRSTYDTYAVVELFHARDSYSGLMTVRTAVAADAPRLAALSGVLGYPVAPEALALRLERLLARSDHTVLVADRGGVVGWVHAAEQELLEYERRCEILGLVVDAEVRGQGVGRRLVSAVERWAAARGLSEVAVRSNVVRTESHPFYERLGYSRVKTQHSYRKRL
ncbi:MAG: N-acetyltransferase family protein [Betaproteobacteria bacterium]